MFVLLLLDQVDESLALLRLIWARGLLLIKYTALPSIVAPHAHRYWLRTRAIGRVDRFTAFESAVVLALQRASPLLLLLGFPQVTCHVRDGVGALSLLWPTLITELV